MPRPDSRDYVVLEKLSPWFLARVLAMMREMGATYELRPDGTYAQTAIVSAWRSYEHQVELYYAPHKYPVARPGTSRHETGHAVDWNWWAVGMAHALDRKYGMHWPVVKPRYENWHMESLSQFFGDDMGYALEGSTTVTEDLSWIAPLMEDT